MNDLVKPIDVKRLEEIILTAPQTDLNTTHAFSGGMYARTIVVPKGTVLTGATHKTDHINIVFGDISVTTEKGVVRLVGYHVLETKAGMKRAGYAHEDTAWTTVCKTAKTELHEVEEELVEEADKLQTRNPLIESNHLEKLEG